MAENLLDEKLNNIEKALSGDKSVPAVEDKLGWHLDYIETLIEQGGGGGGDVQLKTLNGQSLKGQGNIEVQEVYQPELSENDSFLVPVIDRDTFIECLESISSVTFREILHICADTDSSYRLIDRFGQEYLFEQSDEYRLEVTTTCVADGLVERYQASIVLEVEPETGDEWVVVDGDVYATPFASLEDITEVVANPELESGETPLDLTSLQIGEDKYAIPETLPEDIQDMFDDGEVSVDGKYVKIYTPAELNAMTEAEFAQLLNNGCFINGQYFGLWNPILYPSKSDTFGYRSYAQGFNPTTNSLDVVLTQGKQGIQTIYKQYISGTFTLDFIGGVNNALKIYSKTIPAYPTNNSGDYHFDFSGTGLRYAPFYETVVDNSITELPYNKSAQISVAADTTFTLKTPQANSLPEYSAIITTTAQVTLTFTGVTKVKTNDSNITVTEGSSASTLAIPAGIEIEVNIKNGHMIACNWEA